MSDEDKARRNQEYEAMRRSVTRVAEKIREYYEQFARTKDNEELVNE